VTLATFWRFSRKLFGAQGHKSVQGRIRRSADDLVQSASFAYFEPEKKKRNQRLTAPINRDISIEKQNLNFFQKNKTPAGRWSHGAGGECELIGALIGGALTSGQSAPSDPVGGRSHVPGRWAELGRVRGESRRGGSVAAQLLG
jgi:hypothetical protein